MFNKNPLKCFSYHHWKMSQHFTGPGEKYISSQYNSHLQPSSIKPTQHGSFYTHTILFGYHKMVYFYKFTYFNLYLLEYKCFKKGFHIPWRALGKKNSGQVEKIQSRSKLQNQSTKNVFLNRDKMGTKWNVILL